jgi:uncharacterized protein YecE (DUF72 family)
MSDEEGRRVSDPGGSDKPTHEQLAFGFRSEAEAGAEDATADGIAQPDRATPVGDPVIARVRFGTSSFSSEDWVGPFYPAGTKPAGFLRYYASQFDVVEVDSTYYAIPAERTVDGWAAKTPETFRLAAKFPRSIVHGGESARPDPRRVLDPDATYTDRDQFLAVMNRLGGKLGPLVLQFPFFARSAFASAEPFLERLDRFLGDLPATASYAVEIRNPDWLGRDLTEVCRRHRAALVLVDQEWMPHGDRVERRFDTVTSEFTYVRLLGDRKKIEEITTSWGREVIDRKTSLERWAALLARMALRGIITWVFVNNHYAGHAPATVRRLEALFRERLAMERERPSADSTS